MRSRRVPSGRIERVGRFAWLAGGMAASAVTDSARRWISGDTQSYRDLVLSARNGKQLADALAGMRGAAMKLGQMLSLEGGITVPPAFADALARLRDSADKMPRTQLRRVLAREYGRDWMERFAEFDEDPIASASIGQVHRARTRDGRELALKIQFPAVARSIDSDVDNLAALLKASGIIPKAYDIDPLLTVVKDQLHQETDYLQEAKALGRYREMINGDDDVLLPAPHHDLTTPHILAMDYIKARPIESLWEESHDQDLRNRIAGKLQGLTLIELFDTGFMQSDPNFANYMFDPAGGRLVLLDFGSTVEIAPETMERYRRIVSAASRDDRDEVAALAIEFDWVAESDGRAAIDGLSDLILLSAEPLRGTDHYDFGKTDLAERARDISIHLTLEVGFLKPPPPEMLFIQRKLAGTYHLCTQLGARVDSAQMAGPYLNPAG